MRLKFFTAGIALLVLCIALAAPATYYYHIYEPLQTSTGEAMDGVTWFIYAAGTTDTSSIFSDRAGTALYQGDGQTTGSDGMVDCYVIAGTYDIYYTEATKWNTSGTLQNFTYGVADSIGAQQVAAIDTLKPTSGRTVWGRKSTGHDSGILDYARIDVDTLRADELEVLAADGGDDAAIDASIFYADTLKAGLDTTIYFRADDGQDDALFDVAFIAADELDAVLVYADTAKCGIDTTFYVRSDDGQDDALLDVAYIDGVVHANIETVVVQGQIQGGTRDYIWMWGPCENMDEDDECLMYHYDSNGTSPTAGAGWGGFYAGESWGVPLIRDGSITGVASQYYIKDVTTPDPATDSMFVRVFVNGDSVYYMSAAIETGGIHGDYPVTIHTQVPGVSTFSAGDILNCKWGAIGPSVDGADYQNPVVRIEVQYDD